MAETEVQGKHDGKPEQTLEEKKNLANSTPHEDKCKCECEYQYECVCGCKCGGHKW